MEGGRRDGKDILHRLCGKEEEEEGSGSTVEKVGARRGEGEGKRRQEEKLREGEAQRES